jgi:Glycosyltransferase family 87
MNGARASFLRVAGVLAVAFLLIDLAVPIAIDPSLRAYDFAPLYCAGEAVAQGADPYRAMPLGACEHRVAAGPFFASGVVLPAPLPPYALAALRPLAFVPFAAAQHLLDALSLAALALAAYLLYRLTRLPALAVIFALAPIAWIVIALGQPLLIVLAALVACAALLERGHDRWAAAAASLLMVEPHAGAAVCVALFVWRPRTRPVFAGLAFAAAAFSVAVLSWPVVLEYFRDVLPLHARSELFSPEQLSLSAVLVALGVPSATALQLGSLQYAAFALAGTFVARSLAQRLGSAAALALVPPLFAVLGGTFIHATDFLLAVPAALLLAAKTRRSAWITAALVATGTHLRAVGGLPGALLGVVAAPVLIYALHRRAAAASSVAVACGLAVAALTTLPDAPPVVLAAAAPQQFAETSWEAFVRAHPASALDFALRFPMWCGLVALCAAAFELALRRERSLPAAASSASAALAVAP